jgi:hypothetical protein
LYFPYWCGPEFTRWSVIMYPTDVSKFRTALGQAPYDYPFVLTDSSIFYGTGNYNSHTAIPAKGNDLSYLLPHEFGHFFGLNEEYSGGGTELYFGDGVDEPFSQNLTFKTDLADLKWAEFVGEETPLPTDPSSFSQYGTGAYAGGYGGMHRNSHIPVPSGRCIMSTSGGFCEVCAHAIKSKIEFDSGL